MSEQKEYESSVGGSIPGIAILASVVALLVIVVGAYLYRNLSTEISHRPLVIATGPESGTYHAMGKAMQRVLQDSAEFGEVTLQSTDGSVENMALIGVEGGSVDLAFVQGDASPSTYARLIAPLYEEALHILVSTSNAASIKTIYDLEGKKLSLGSAGSGTRELSQRVLEHFAVTPGEDQLLTPREAATALKEDRIDAVFMLAALPSELIAELAEDDSIRFISLGGLEESGDEAHALELVFPGVHRATIPRATYARLPEEAVHTVSVSALLVARDDLEESLARDITAMVFGYSRGQFGLEGGELIVARRIRENYDPSAVTIPYHSGAAAYYLREEPSFFVKYAEAMSLLITFMLALYSLFIALREWLRRRMKNRIDRYLVEVETLVSDVGAIDHEALLERRRALEELRRAAFADLVSERLLADSAFIILQNHMRDELIVVDQRLTETDLDKSSKH